MVASNDMGVVVDPKFPLGEEGNWCVACPKILAIFRDKKIFSIEEIIIDMINNSRCTVVWIRPRLPLCLLHRNADRIKVVRQLAQQVLGPITSLTSYHTPVYLHDRHISTLNRPA